MSGALGAGSQATPLAVAYLVNQYPSVSHSFIRREINALERQGVLVHRFAIRPSKEPFLSEEDKEEAAKTRHILSLGTIAIARAAAAGFLSAPVRALAALAEAQRAPQRAPSDAVRRFAYWVEALVLARWLRESRLPHVHAHFGTNSATVAMLAARIAGAKFSFTVHGPEEFDIADFIALGRKVEASAFTVCVSQYGESQLRRRVAPAQWGKIRIVRCGVERAFHEGRSPSAPGGADFVSVGRLSEQKGQLTLVEAAAILKREGRAFRIRLIGDGPMRAEIEQAVAREDVADRVVLLGWKTPGEVRSEIEAARAFVLPSYAEGLPVSIMEAFALERPVISTYVAGIPELVIPGENGWLAPAADAGALAAALAAALDAAPASLQAMGRAGKALTLARHDADREAGVLKAHFAAAVGGRP